VSLSVFRARLVRNACFATPETPVHFAAPW
jgi:hypothetical protein